MADQSKIGILQENRAHLVKGGIKDARNEIERLGVATEGFIALEALQKQLGLHGLVRDMTTQIKNIGSYQGSPIEGTDNLD